MIQLTLRLPQTGQNWPLRYFTVEVVEHVGVWVRGLGTKMDPTLSPCTIQDQQEIKFVGDCKAQITILNITTSKTLF